MGVHRVRLLLLGASASIGLLALLYLVARGTALGLRLDGAATELGLTEGRAPRIHDATTDVLRTIDVSSLALFGGGTIVLALLRRRIGHALAIAGLLVGANVTTQLLKPFLADASVPGVGPSQAAVGTFPSGHATVAMSLGLAAILAVPEGLRAVAALAGAGYATAVGVALVALEWHYPSDVVGGYLVASAWAALLAAGVVAVGMQDPRRASVSGEPVAAVLLLAAGAFAIIVGVAIARRPELVVLGRLHTAFFASAVGLATASIAITGSIAVLIEPSPRRAAPRG